MQNFTFHFILVLQQFDLTTLFLRVGPFSRPSLSGHGWQLWPGAGICRQLNRCLIQINCQSPGRGLERPLQTVLCSDRAHIHLADTLAQPGECFSQPFHQFDNIQGCQLIDGDIHGVLPTLKAIHIHKLLDVMVSPFIVLRRPHWLRVGVIPP